MGSYQYSFKTTHLALGFVLLTLAVGFRVHHRHVAVDDGLREALRQRIVQGYSGRNAMEAAKLAVENRAGMPGGDASGAGSGAVERSVDFLSISAHAKKDPRLGATTTWIRAVIRVDGGIPPDGRTTRYFRMYQSGATGLNSGLADSDVFAYYSTMIR